MELSKRLRMNAGLVPPGSVLADIGCDHGYVSIYLAKENICPRVIAVDVNAGPLRIAEENIRRYGVADRVECRLSDGLAALVPGEADTLLAAGMGGMLICRILRECPVPEVIDRIHTLVLQPQSDFFQVRKTLHCLGFSIEREAFCVDNGKDYLALCAVRAREGGEERYTDSEYEYGRCLPMAKDEEYRKYLLREKEKTAAVCQKLEGHEAENIRDRREELLHILNRIDERLKIYEEGEHI